jgi:Ca2+-binding RTX toxin-like protein
MLQQFTTQAFTRTGTLGVNQAGQLIETQLVDSDLLRGNGTTETATVRSPVQAATAPLQIFDGFTNFVQTGTSLGSVVQQFDDGEVSTLVTFSDGSSLGGVLGLYDVIYGAYNTFVEWHVLDQSALAAAGKTLADVVSVTNQAFVDHDLNWGDFGFSPTGVIVPDPVPPPQPDPEPPLNLVQGTSRNDQLFGTARNDLVRGGGDDDRLTGGAGADSFVFGADARDRDRDRDVITDFNANEDTIVFEAGATIRFIEQRGVDLFIQLEGDRDSITVLNANRGIVANFEFTDGIFLA